MHRDGHFDYSLLPSRTISLPLTTPTSCSPSPSHYLRYTRSFIPTWFHHPALSPPFFLLFLSFPSPLPSLLFSIHSASLHSGSTGPTCCSRVRAITISSRAFFATSRVLTSSLEEEMNWVIVKSCPAVIASACSGPRPAAGFLNDPFCDPLWIVVFRCTIVRDTKGFHLGKFYGEWRISTVIMNRLKIILLYSDGKLFEFPLLEFVIVFIFLNDNLRREILIFR